MSSNSSSSSYNENSTTSGNAYKGRSLKRMELQYKDIDIKFAVNPSDYTQTKPNKATITQTKGGAWIDAWGAGIVEFTIKGTTGVKGSGNSIDTGYQRWKKLEGLFDELYDSVTDGEEITDLIAFYNHTDNIFYYCYPTQNGIELNRSASKPHIYQYTIHLWGIRKIGQPATSSGTIGNPNKTTNSSTTTQTSKNQSVSISGGNTYTTKNRMVAYANTEVDSQTTTNTKTKTIQGIQDDCLSCLTALEPIIGGKGGKISPITGFQCTQGITMQSSGTISNVNSFTGADLSSDTDMLLVETKFTSKVSVETYDLYTNIMDYSPEVLSPEYSLITGTTPKQRVIQAVSNSKSYDSTIYSLIVQYQPKSILTKTEVNHLKVILLESMMVYMKLHDIYEQSEELSTTLTMTSMGILIQNIQAMIMYFTFNSTENNRYQKMDISAELRTLEKIMTQVCTDVVDYL